MSLGKLFGRDSGEAAPEAERLGTWADTGYSASDGEAHRDARYDGCSPASRVYTVFRGQMKLFSKNKWMYLMVVAAVLIPVIAIIMPDVLKDLFVEASGGSTQYIGFLLCLMPLMASFFTSVLCGTQIPNEFKERTAYMSIPLPVTRAEFYLGKYLAGFVLCLGVFLMAFGFAILTAMLEFDTIFGDIVGESLGITAVMIFAYSATAYCIGTFMRRGSALVPAALMFIVLPAVFFYLYVRTEIDAFMLLPCFLPDAALSILGSPLIMSSAGVLGYYPDPTSVVTMLAIGIVWGVAVLLLGLYRMQRREMR